MGIMRDKDTLHVLISDETFKSDSKLLNGIDKIKKNINSLVLSKKPHYIIIGFKKTYDFRLKNNLDKMKMLLPLKMLLPRNEIAVVFISYDDDNGSEIGDVIEKYEYNLPYNKTIKAISYGELNRRKRTKPNLIEI